MAYRSCCGSDCDNPRTIFCEYDFGECVARCECYNLPVGSVLDWPIDYSDILGTDCEDPHIIDQINSSVSITQTGGSVGLVTISSTEFTNDVMTVWIDASNAADGGYHELTALLVSDKGRQFTHKIKFTSKDVKCS